MGHQAATKCKVKIAVGLDYFSGNAEWQYISNPGLSPSLHMGEIVLKEENVGVPKNAEA